MKPLTSRRSGEPDSHRKGVPFTVYFPEALAEALTFAADGRKVSKATLVRFAVERLLKQLEDGQLQLPLGL